MNKAQTLFYLNRFREQRVNHEAEARAGTSYGDRAEKVEQAQSPEQAALSIAIQAVEMRSPEDAIFGDS